MITIKSFEIIIMIGALICLWFGDIHLLLGALFLMATQSAFFGPAKFGILPERFTAHDLVHANALVQMATIIAIIAGSVAGGWVLQNWGGQPFLMGGMLISIAVLGFMTSWGIMRVPGPNRGAGTASLQKEHLAYFPWTGAAKGFSAIFADYRLRMATLGRAWFWLLGALLQLSLLLYGKESLALSDAQAGQLVAFCGIGIAVGSLITARLSSGQVELGLVPLGAFALVIFLALLPVCGATSYEALAILLIFLGMAGGVYIVPLNAYIQAIAGDKEKGRILASAAIMDTIGIFIASGLLYLCNDVIKLEPGDIFPIAAILTAIGGVIAFRIMPDLTLRLISWLLTHLLYRIKLIGRENLPDHGPALIVCNHVSYVDPLLVAASTHRIIRFISNRYHYSLPVLNWGMRKMHVIPVSKGQSAEMIEAAVKALQDGHMVCIFAEGMISRTGNLLKFRSGLERIAQKANAPIIPAHLDRVWGSIFSFEGGKPLSRWWPKELPYRITLSFGKQMPATSQAWQVRRSVQSLGSAAFSHRFNPQDTLASQFVKSARKNWKAPAIADSAGVQLTYGETLIGASLIAKEINKSCPDEDKIGILLPASGGGALANIATTLAGRVSVNLNFTTGQEGLVHAIGTSDLRTILTSSKFAKKLEMDLAKGWPADVRFISMEEIGADISTFDKTIQALKSKLLPPRWQLSKQAAERDIQSPATILFSSGSTGNPKGIVLSHQNILANMQGVSEVLGIAKTDCFLAVLPFFHAFGLTGTLWIPLLNGAKIAAHPNPLDGKGVGKLADKEKATVLIATPTFCRLYLKQITPEQFSSLRHVVVGAERLSDDLANKFADKFTITPLEGYGCTEMGPVVAVNILDVEEGKIRQRGLKKGSVGHPIPGVSAKIVGIEDESELDIGQEGRLFVRGPGRMVGYLKDPRRTEATLSGDWYITGDVAKLDADGFITITDRLARFSKIAGEMVPHGKIEEAIEKMDQIDKAAVVSLPDAQKGERLVGFYSRHKPVTIAAILDHLNDEKLPNLWIPKKNSLFEMEEIPILGTGKIDFQKLKRIAKEKIG